MFRRTLCRLVFSLSLVSLTPAAAGADPGGQVFFGRYDPGDAGFYDPFVWSGWGPSGYWYPDWRPQVRVKVEPEDIGDDAAVYVDGLYAGVVDDFDGWGVIVEEGPHTIAIFREGYRTARFKIHAGQGKIFTVRHTLRALPAGARSEPPDVERPVRESAAGSSSERRARPDGR